MKSTLNPLLIFSLKVIVLVAFIYITNQGFDNRINYLLENQNYSTLVIFLILWLFSILVLVFISFHKSALYRIFWGLIIALTSAISYGFYAAGGSELEVLDIFELWQAKHETGRAIAHFTGPAINAAIVALLGFLIIVYPSRLKAMDKIRKFSALLFFLPIIPICIFSSLIFIKSDKAVESLPQQFTPVSMALAITYKSAMHEIPDRENVKNAPENKAKTKHLLYLVDESINPNYIFSNDGKYLKGFNDNIKKIADFGVAVSGSNCSARSNAILRLGATRDNLIQSVRSSPSIWQYAKKAGFRTVYIDSQDSSKVVTKPNDYQNYMSAAEVKFIDKFYKVKNVEPALLDYELLRLVEKELESDIPTFIYANKNGAHFPYSDNYPESEAIHQPVLNNNNAHGLSSLLSLYSEGKGLQAVINTYKNSINWTVDKFFRQFFNDVDLNKTTVIYTSDHGQHFEIKSTTHCTSGDGAPVEEGLVPLMLMSSNPNLMPQFMKAAKLNYNKADHFSLFPTVLNLLGYSKTIQKSYGSTLFDMPQDRLAAFNTGDILGIISMDTIWREVSQDERELNSQGRSMIK